MPCVGVENWTILLRLCGDSKLDREVRKYLNEIAMPSLQYLKGIPKTKIFRSMNPQISILKQELEEIFNSLKALCNSQWLKIRFGHLHLECADVEKIAHRMTLQKGWKPFRWLRKIMNYSTDISRAGVKEIIINVGGIRRERMARGRKERGAREKVPTITLRVMARFFNVISLAPSLHPPLQSGFAVYSRKDSPFFLVRCTRPLSSFARSLFVLQMFDDFIFMFFALEMAVKMIAMGICGKGTYLADSWNRLDFFIVLAGWARA